METIDTVVVTHEQFYIAHFKIMSRDQEVTEAAVADLFDGYEPVVEDTEERECIAKITEAVELANSRYLEKAVKVITPLAESRSSIAQLILGSFYEALDDFDQAKRWYRRSHDQGNPTAAYKLALAVERGGTTDSETAESGALMYEAANAGDAAAQFYLGDGLRGLVEQDPDLAGDAAHWFLLAAEQGHVRAQFALGQFYLNGTGVDRDMDAALHWFHLAAFQGHSKAQYYLGFAHLMGSGVTRDSSLAIRWYKRAARQGHNGAQQNLAIMIDQGIGTPRDPFSAYVIKSIPSEITDREDEVIDEISRAQQRTIGDSLTAEQITQAEMIARRWTIGDPLPIR